MKNHTCKFCEKELDSDREFCDGVCMENYAEQEEDREYREAMRS